MNADIVMSYNYSYSQTTVFYTGSRCYFNSMLLRKFLKTPHTLDNHTPSAILEMDVLVNYSTYLMCSFH